MVFTVWHGEVGKGGEVEGEERRKRSLCCVGVRVGI
jgi:hypothetical protein